MLLVLFIWKVLPRLNQLLDERSKAIAGRIDEAKHAREEAERVLSSTRSSSPRRGRRPAASATRPARTAKRIIAELREQASAEAARITAQAQAQIEAERASAVQSLRAEVGSLALDLASGVIGRAPRG